MNESKIFSHLAWPNLVNKYFIMMLLNKFLVYWEYVLDLQGLWKIKANAYQAS